MGFAGNIVVFGVIPAIFSILLLRRRAASRTAYYASHTEAEVEEFKKWFRGRYPHAVSASEVLVYVQAYQRAMFERGNDFCVERAKLRAAVAAAEVFGFKFVTYRTQKAGVTRGGIDCQDHRPSTLRRIATA